MADVFQLTLQACRDKTFVLDDENFQAPIVCPRSHFTAPLRFQRPSGKAHKLARIIHEDTPFVNNAPAGAGSAAPPGFDRPLPRLAQG
jgi:hypothetical protein